MAKGTGAAPLIRQSSVQNNRGASRLVWAIESLSKTRDRPLPRCACHRGFGDPVKGVHCFGGAPRRQGTRHDHEDASNGASKKPLDHAIGALSTGFDPADGRIGWCGFADHLEVLAERDRPADPTASWSGHWLVESDFSVFDTDTVRRGSGGFVVRRRQQWMGTRRHTGSRYTRWRSNWHVSG